MARFLDEPAQWDRLAAALLRAGSAGIDSETYGQPEKTSPAHRARIHHWSVAILGASEHPRGYRIASGVVLPVCGLEHAGLREALQRTRLVAHNAPHDEHAFANEGLALRIDDLLQPLRVAVPGRGDYGLKDFERWGLGKPARPEFRDLVTYRGKVEVLRGHKERRCACGNVPCRKPSKSTFVGADGVERPHTRTAIRIERTEAVDRVQEYDIRDFRPGAVLAPLEWVPRNKKSIRPAWWDGRPRDRWQAWLDYSAADAVSAAEEDNWLTRRKFDTAKLEQYPWYDKFSDAS